MHNIVQKGLEDYLGGRAPRDFQAHLDRCSECAEEVVAMRELSGMFSVLRPQEDAPQEVPPAFYVQVAQRIESSRPKPIFWNVFSQEPSFLRRVAFASLMLLAILGSYLASRESVYSKVRSPEVLMAEHDTSGPHDGGADRGPMLVTLAAYRQ